MLSKIVDIIYILVINIIQIYSGYAVPCLFIILKVKKREVQTLLSFLTSPSSMEGNILHSIAFGLSVSAWAILMSMFQWILMNAVVNCEWLLGRRKNKLVQSLFPWIQLLEISDTSGHNISLQVFADSLHAPDWVFFLHDLAQLNHYQIQEVCFLIISDRLKHGRKYLWSLFSFVEDCYC